MVSFFLQVILLVRCSQLDGLVRIRSISKVDVHNFRLSTFFFAKVLLELWMTTISSVFAIQIPRAQFSPRKKVPKP